MRLITLLFILIANVAFSQNKIRFDKEVNLCSFSKKLYIINYDDELKAALYLDIRNQNGIIDAIGINVLMFNFEDEHYDNELILRFEDGTIFAKNSSMGYQIGYHDWFYLDEIEVNKLGTTNLESVSFMDGMYYDIIDVELPEKDQDYFIEALSEVKKINVLNNIK